MNLTNCYATLDEFKQKFYPAGTTSVTAEDTMLKNVLENTCRAIDLAYGRHWHPVVATRYFSTASPEYCLTDDLLAVTTLATDDAGDRAYSTIWSASDYDLEPFNAPDLHPPQPYTRILVAPNSGKRFPTLRRGVKLAGTFGFYDVRRTASATVAEAVDSSETVIDVSAATEFSEGQTLLIGSEQMHVQSVDTTSTPKTLTVLRARNGTTAAAHDSGAAIQIYEYPIVHEVALLMAERLHKRKDAIFGIVGSAEMGQIVAIAKQDPDVKLLMQPFMKVRI